MSDKIGRNAPCPCGSGRKYKHCHGKPQAVPEPADDSHEGAIERAVAWLAQYHRKAFGEAVQQEIDEAALACFDDDEEAAFAALDELPEEIWHQAQINFTEWLIAEGSIRVKRGYAVVSTLLLGPGGPRLSSGQRDWIEQLARRPLRLYDVTDAKPGEGITLCDAIDTGQPPVFVTEHTGSHSLRPGMQIAARLIEAGGEHLISGALYVYAPPVGRALQTRLQAVAADEEMFDEDRPLFTGLAIVEHWLAQFLLPAPLPDFVDAASGEPMLLTTDHYDVASWPTLEAALAAQPDVEGSAEHGWSRLVEGDDGLMRPVASVNPGPERKRVSVFYKTAGHAERGRPWFEQIAGDAVRFVIREVSDPKGLLQDREALAHAAQGTAPSMPEGIDPAALADALAGAIRRTYANWADEPVPALGGRTPRQAIATPAGLERVKGLLRSYEDGEADAAKSQQRSAISYQFLWDALGIER